MRPVGAANWRTVYGAPILTGLISLSGLVSALLFNEVGRYFSWIAVGSPIIIVLYIVAAKLCRPTS
ncbi:hypothetical protein SAMN05444158_1427 [Bradyrhizobium canariense]|uniref:Uncharacterized protein n=1 Tax=Bradyrhizobium canariense TaxID=255045 RepID=A0A1H1QJM0_9BRAD|nr:hypothetical protein SAMN05444158_1427 [Bradyrhizobium canariense]